MLPASRAVLRIARRNVARNRWRSVLIALLVLVPVAGMVGAVTYLRTTTPTAEAYATSLMGEADAFIYSAPRGTTTDGLREQLPAGTRIEPMTSWEGTLVLSGRKLRTQVQALDLDGLGAGILTLTAGRLPRHADEAAISRHLATAAGLALGDALELEGVGRLELTGYVESDESLSSRVLVAHHSFAGDNAATGVTSWLLSLPPQADVEELQRTLEVYTRDSFAHWAGDVLLAMLVFGGLVMVETVLVAAAGFAVSIRRRERELGILAASGAQPRHLAGTVLGEGLLLGGVASAAGAAIGFAAVLALSPWLDQLADRRNPPVVLDSVAISLAVMLGVLAAVIAAAAPAWTAARLPVLTALSGRRPPMRSARRTLALGLALIALAAVLTALAASIIVNDQMSSTSALMLGLAAILSVLGFGASSPWIVERLEWLGRRLPVSARIAMRDTARARSRSAPIVTAMLAGLAVAVATSASIASAAAAQQADWRPWLRADQLMISDDEALVAGPEVAGQLNAVAAAPLAIYLQSLDGSERSLQVLYDPAGGAVSVGPEHQINCGDCWGTFVGLGSEPLLEAMGAESALEAFRRGEVIVFTEQPVLLRGAVVRIDTAFERSDYIEFLTTHTEVVPALGVAAGIPHFGGRLPGALIPPAMLARLGFIAEAAEGDYGEYLIRLDHPVTEEDVARAADLLAGRPGAFASGSFPPVVETLSERILVLGLSLLLALTIAAIAVALGEAEARADQRTLLAVGADPRIRRRIAAGRAGVLALIAGLLAVPAGLLPVWGLSHNWSAGLTVPALEIVVMVILLPVAAVGGVLLLARPIPQWSAFRDIFTS